MMGMGTLAQKRSEQATALKESVSERKNKNIILCKVYFHCECETKMVPHYCYRSEC